MATVRDRLISLKSYVEECSFIEDYDGDDEKGRPLIRRVFFPLDEKQISHVKEELDELIKVKTPKLKVQDSNSELLYQAERRFYSLCTENNITHRRADLNEKVFSAVKRTGLYSADAISDDDYYVYYQSALRDSIFPKSKYNKISKFSSMSLVKFDISSTTVLLKVHIDKLEDVDTFFDECMKIIK